MKNREKLIKLILIGILLGYANYLLDDFPELRKYFIERR
jgi:hypothetical protein